MAESQSHPYAPADLKLEGYVPVVLPQSTIIGIYFGVSIFVVSLIWIFSGRFPKITKVDRLLMCWWVFTALTHSILEGYFTFSPEFYKDKTAFYLAEVWKEYSKGDSRYAGRDAAIVAVEGITSVLEGPASLLAMYAIATRKSYSHILQIAISLGQLYGAFVYFITAFLDGDKFAASTFYYYSYFVGANSPWIVIPTLITIRSWKKICAAMEAFQGQNKTKTR
ncbi:putative 3-beta-hydroxysteroid-Delta(8),Delta(7)-isomerase [Morus notabilis]|uniref:Putative 3-beta-hydroxysteroid-Delta(8),Delta(7)-isomerase n=1 Tax=Morus notabilis TaxID=981085 RepID=W9RKD1_9ROSA|nr:probable 3-beta-hydroxysteroid-Delta(8),Delta(7)-isomerase [Morus notabilis]EXB95310.1 putative 3-beta-hydroxysteroid-Delta(8),Delta(7)-isomerase [Morus notabilis]